LLTPFEFLSEKDFPERIDRLFKTLNDRETKVIAHRFGLNGTAAKSLEQVGELLGVTHERARHRAGVKQPSGSLATGVVVSDVQSGTTKSAFRRRTCENISGRGPIVLQGSTTCRLGRAGSDSFRSSGEQSGVRPTLKKCHSDLHYFRSLTFQRAFVDSAAIFNALE
jgi:Sigma-70, region 4